MSDQAMLPPTDSKPSNRTLLIGVFAVLTLLIGVVLFAIFALVFNNVVPDEDPLIAAAGAGTIGGATPIDPPRIVEDFTLISHTGDPVSLSDFSGKPVILYFGYTYCPDVCPMTLMELRRVRQALGEQAQDVGFIFVSVDGERDTPEWMARYFETRGVDDFMTGLTGDDLAIKRIGVDYGLYYEKRTDTGSQANYLVDHTASTFLINPDGKLATIFSFGTAPDVITEHLQAYLQ